MSHLSAPAWGRITLLLCLLVTTSCSREYYRTQADRNVEALVAEKSSDPRWALPAFRIQMDPRGRYFDPYPEDTTPMPPDDPASHEFMHRVDNKRAWPYWHQWGDRTRLENPTWRNYLAQYVPLTDEAEIVLSVPSALRLAYMHSPDHQQQLETIYLSALDVATERFRLQTQFYGGNDSFIQNDGRLRFNPLQRGANRVGTDTAGQVTRNFATAGSLMIDFVNSFMWSFGGTDTNTASSSVAFLLFQPFLRNAGRDIALERLTIVERTLLGNLRAYARYRKGFYTNIAIGESGAGGASRQGGFLGGTGLTGFSGTGAGGLGGVGAATGFGSGRFAGAGGTGGGAGAGFAGGGAGTVGGFIGLLQTLQEIRNTEVSLESQIRTLSLLEANLEAGIIDLTQVDQFRQNIETERATLLQARNGFDNAIENYLTGTLGLPPDIRVKLDDQLIRQFQFIDLRTTAAQSALEDLQDQLGEVVSEASDSAVTEVFTAANAGLSRVEAVAENVLLDLEVLDERVPARVSTMGAAEGRLFEREVQTLRESFVGLVERLDRKRPLLEEIQGSLQQNNPRQSLDSIVVWLRDLIALVQELSLVQARARVESIVLEPVDIDAQTAFRFATTYRLDIMNNRAALVNSWRLIEFNARSLRSDLSVRISGDIGTVGDNPIDFRGANSTIRAGLQFDPPFTRLLERNNYRQALIDYQQDRRSLIQFYDVTYRSLRQLIRVMEQLEVNMEIQRRAVVIAIRRVDLTREDLNEPTPPPQPGQPASQLGPTAALNLLTALSDLRSTQNNFMSVWLNYYANRMRLHRDTGLMQLDEEGRWIDMPLFEAVTETPPETEESLPPPLPEEWIQDAFEGVPEEMLPDFEVIQTSFGKESPDSPESP